MNIRDFISQALFKIAFRITPSKLQAGTPVNISEEVNKVVYEYPDYDIVIRSSKFTDWMCDQSYEIKRASSSVYAVDAIKVLRKYFDDTRGKKEGNVVKLFQQ